MKKEIEAAVERNRGFLNFYELEEKEEGKRRDSLEAEFQKAVNRQTSEMNTHPSPADRFKLIRQIVVKEVTADKKKRSPMCLSAPPSRRSNDISDP